MSETVARLPLAALAGAGGFRLDMRFARMGQSRSAPPAEPAPEPEDPVAIAYAEGFSAGVAEARAQAAEQARIDAQARAALQLSLSRLDDRMAEELRLRLRDTVAALCEEAIAPLALDENALMQRISRAVSMFRRADDERVIHLNPDDLALVSTRMAEDWHVVPDPALERGALRVECANGGVEDGPETWRRAIAEALHQC